ncbi:MAG TPA: amidase [Planctomycetaceae bacterium]|nr:amidase [Planctomycetaceae bacterium]
MEPLTCSDIAAAVQSRRRSALEFADEALARAAAHQEKFRPFIRVTPELARDQARRVDERIKAGEKLPLAGVPFAVKDLFHFAGLPTTYGSRVFADAVQTETATSIQKLISAGAVLIGKLNLHECAFGFTGENPHFGDCRNPWDPARIPGGSSSGSAVAIALGICPLTLGSDTGGSIRLPAALCGVTGLKPTYGRVSRTGGYPLSWTMDHVGPLARTAAETAIALRVLAGHDASDESSSRRSVPDYPAEIGARLRGLKVAVMHQWFFEALDPEVASAVTQALDTVKSLGATLVEVHLPHLEEALGAHRAIIFPEASAFHQSYLAGRAPQYGDDIRPLLLGGQFLPAVDYLQALRVRRRIRREWAQVFDGIDALATPTSPITAPNFGAQTADLPGGPKPLVRAFLDLTLPFNLSGHPALSVPCGFSQAGLPIGLQLVGKPFGESALLRIAHQYQQETAWHKRVPGAQT